MKQIITLIFILLLTACGHNIPTATLTFTKIEKNPAYDNSYFLYFSSDIELLKNLSEQHTGAQLRCLFNQQKINKENFIGYKGYIFRESKNIIQLKGNSGRYTYYTELTFDKEGERYIKKKDYPKILALLNTKPTCLNCVVTAASYLDIPRRYISNTMCLPKEALKKVID